MSSPNVFAVSRTIWTDEDFAPEPFTEREAFVWLVGEAAWRDRKARGARGPVCLKRGEVVHSIRFCAEAWRWSKSRVARFFETLKKRDIIRDTSRDSEKIYSIKNYNRFQVVGLPKRDAERDAERDEVGTEAGHERDRLETGKQGNRKEDSEAKASAAQAPRSDGEYPDPRAEVFGLALPILTAQGNSEATARSAVGAWRKAYGNHDAALHADMVEVAARKPADFRKAMFGRIAEANPRNKAPPWERQRQAEGDEFRKNIRKFENERDGFH